MQSRAALSRNADYGDIFAGWSETSASRECRLPSPQRGPGGEGDISLPNQPRNSALDEDLRMLLTPLPRWGEGTEIHRVSREMNSFVTIFCSPQ